MTPEDAQASAREFFDKFLPIFALRGGYECFSEGASVWINMTGVTLPNEAQHELAVSLENIMLQTNPLLAKSHDVLRMA